MPVDGCPYSFRTLATRVLPGRMKEMWEAMHTAVPLRAFATSGLGLMGLMDLLGVAVDFSGCYVLIRRRKPVYVGISRGVLNRLRSHVRGKSHSSATLAYRMTAAEHDLDFTREQQMQDSAFLRRFSRVRKQMQQWRVAWIPITNPVELHLFEVYCAMELGTSRWNTFKTH